MRPWPNRPRIAHNPAHEHCTTRLPQAVRARPGQRRPGPGDRRRSAGPLAFAGGSPRHAARVRHRPFRGPGDHPGHDRGSGKADAGAAHARRARAGRRQLARLHGSAARAAHRAAQGRARRGARAGQPLEPRPARRRDRTRARPVRGAPRARRARCPRKDEDIAYASVRDLSRWIESRALTAERLDDDLPRSSRAVPAPDQRHHHPHARPCPRAGAQGGRGDRGRAVPRPAARHSLGRQGPRRHRRHRHHLRGRALPRSRAREGRDGGGRGCTARAPSSWPS